MEANLSDMPSKDTIEWEAIPFVNCKKASLSSNSRSQLRRPEWHRLDKGPIVLPNEKLVIIKLFVRVEAS
jgi:hypothetical protein